MKNEMTTSIDGKRPTSAARNPWFKFAIEFGPLALFFVANSRPKFFEPVARPFLPLSLLTGQNGALFTATLVLMMAVAAALGASFAYTKRVPFIPLITSILALLFGGLTLFLQDATFIKMKPTILYCGFSASLLVGLAFKKPVLAIIFDEALALTERGWRILTLRWGCFFGVLAVLNEAIWRTQSNDLWVAFKFPGIFILIFAFSMAQVRLIMKHRLPEEESECGADHYES